MKSNGENGTILDVSAAVQLLFGETVTIDDLCELMPERNRQAILTSMNRIEKTSGRVYGIRVVRQSNPKTWRIAGPVAKARPVVKAEAEPEEVDRVFEIQLAYVGDDSNGGIIGADSQGKLYRVTPL